MMKKVVGNFTIFILNAVEIWTEHDIGIWTEPEPRIWLKLERKDWICRNIHLHCAGDFKIV